MARASKAVGTAFTAMLGAFAVDQIIAAGKESLEYASSLGEVASQLGTTTKALQEYRYVATQTGIEQDEMDKGLARLSKTIGEAAGGNEKAAKMFDRLGISIRDSSGNVKDAGDLLPEIADAYTKLGSAAEQSALSAEVFGAKLGQKLNPMLAEGSKGILAMRDRANDLGLVLDDAMIQNADEAADKISELSQFIKMKFTATVADNAKAIGSLADELINLVSKIGSVREEWRKLELTMRQIDIWTEPLGSSSWSSRMERSTALGREKDLYDRENSEAYQRGLKAAQRSAERQRMAPAYSGVGVSRKTPFSIAPKAPWPTTRAFGANAFGGTDWSQFAPGQGEGFIKLAQAANDLPKPLGLADAMFENMATVNAPRLLATVKELTPAAEQMRGVTQSILDRLFPEEAEMRRYKEELAALNASLKAGELTTEDYARAVTVLRQEFDGFAQTIRDNAEIVATGIGPTMDDMLDQADASWERFSIGLIDQSARTRDEVVANFLSLAAGVGDALGQLIGGKTGRIIGGIFNLIGAAAPLFGGARADGGPVSAGRAYLVGEKGPELMIPGMSGMVIPNHALPQLVAPPAGNRISPSNDHGSVTRLEIVDTTNLFRFKVNGQIMEAAPSIASAGAAGGVSQMTRKGSRRVA
ncbi:MAG: hypothetical protein JNN10_09200 [Sphingopyxis sp.]|uniref:hypothetical protein n=1 Tax=Sphingopyxis sp. TaxID=1908224 RepID=UPI001A3B4E9E|nr:hypothetical protein [Sphingopyxis sp.]MBL9066455.1 hypothetical protein [Sphingopyxis sp.]